MVTPSFVISGEPNFLSKTTYLPFGPNVAFTALESFNTPVSNLLLASSSKAINFAAMIHSPLLSFRGQPRLELSLSETMRYSSPSTLNFSSSILGKYNDCRQLELQVELWFRLSKTLPLPTAKIFPFCGFSFAVSGITIPDFVFSSSSNGFQEHSVAQRFNLHKGHLLAI